jgi:5-methylcytosine-specific restriction enzyme subunit McrC
VIEMQIVELEEWQEREIPLSATQERALRAEAGTRLQTLPGAPGQFRIRANSHVGAIVTSDVVVLIRPKATTSMVLHLASVDDGLFAIEDTESLMLETQELLPGLATLYLSRLERLVRRGIGRSYGEQFERVPAIRGRIDLRGHLRAAGLTVPMACVFDEFTVDTRLNRRAKAAALILARLPGVGGSVGLRLRRLAAEFDGAGELRGEDIRGESTFSRLNDHHRPVDGLATLVFRSASVEPRNGLGSVASFTLNMNTVFERFVAARLRVYLRGRLRVTSPEATHLDIGQKVKIEPDLVFRVPGTAERVFVADTKYKLTSTGLGRQADYYQLLAYTAALDLPRGLLIYCRNDEGPIDREICIGASGTRLGTSLLSLEGTARDIEFRISLLADQIATAAEGNLVSSVAQN